MMEEKILLRLSEAETHALKEECKLGNSFLWMGVLAAFLCILLVILFGESAKVFWIAIIVAALLVLIGLLICRHINKDLYADLANGEKVVVVKPLDRLEMNPLFDPTRASSTAFDNRLSKRSVGYYVFSGKMSYPVTPATYEQLQGASHFEYHYAPHSYTSLGVYPVSNH